MSVKNLRMHHWLSGLILALATVSAWATPATSYYIYDEQGHVIGEYDANGNPVQEHVYLGDRPVAVAVTSGATTTVDYVSTDQLNTPRVVTDSSQNVVWTWNSDPFGNGTPSGSLTYNLRFPGQYYDAETGHNYNYFRDYDSGTGRYLESDPLGLGGGINTYTYSLGNPVNRTDPTGQLSPQTQAQVEKALARAMGSEVGGGGPEDPLGDILALGFLSEAVIEALSGDPTPQTDGGTCGPKDPCKWLRIRLAEHQQKLRDYLLDPYAADNKGILGQGYDQSIMVGRVSTLVNAIEGFKRELAECERIHGSK